MVIYGVQTNFKLGGTTLYQKYAEILRPEHRRYPKIE